MFANLIHFPPRGIAGAIGAGIFVLTPGTFVQGALAQSSIGAATVVQNDVRGHTGGEIFRIARGDNVFLDQFVQTSTNSKAKIVFLDTTNMSVGPDSVVKLDQFVYSGNGKAQSVSINATKGAFRFFSGSSEHQAYKVTTPQAVIGVRGTTYDVLVANGQTFVKLQEGAITACVRTGSTCRDVDRPGQYIIINDTSIEGPFDSNNNTWDFGSLCGGGAADLCRKTQFAMNNPPPPPPGGGGFQPPPPQSPPPVRHASLPTPVYVPPPPPQGPVYPPQVYNPPQPPRVTVPPVVTIPPYVPPYTPPNMPPRDPCKYGGARGCGPSTTPPPPVDTGCKPSYGRASSGCGPSTTPPPTNTGCNAGFRRIPGCGTGPTKPPKGEGRPTKPPQTGPILKQAGPQKYPTRWAHQHRQNYGNANRFSQMPRMNQRFGMAPQVRSAPRFSQAPRMSTAPRMASMSRGPGGFRR